MLRLKIEFRIEVNGTVHTGAIRLVDAVAIERHFDVSLTHNDPKNWSFDHMMYGAYNALRRAGVEVGEYEQFLEGIDGLDVDDDEDDDAPKETA